jgi:hypothetical protein
MSLALEQSAKLSLTKAHSLGQHGLKSLFQIAGRTRNNLQHLRGGRLLLERFSEIVRALAQLIEQAGVLDGDHGLSGETGKQRDLLVGERTDFLPIAGDHPNNIILLEHRNGDDCPNLAKLDGCDNGRNAFRIPPCCCQIGDLDRFFGSDCFRDVGSRGGHELSASAQLGERRWHVVPSRQMHSAILMEKKKCAKSSVTEPRAVRQHRLEHRCEFAERTADDS